MKRRFRLVQGESLSTALSVFFGSKATRRDFEFRKFGPPPELPEPEAEPGIELSPPGMFDEDFVPPSLLAEEEPERPGDPDAEPEDAPEPEPEIVEDPVETIYDTHPTLVRRIGDMIDQKWYAERHGLAADWDEPITHFCLEGLERAYAPCPEMAGEDGLTMAHWAVEVMIRYGIKVGPRGIEDSASIDAPGLLDPLSLTNPDGKKIAVVTAIFGAYDQLMPVKADWAAKADFFLFSDQVFETGPVWQQVHSSYYHEDPTRRARFIKLHLPSFFSEYDSVIWIDGNVLICEDPERILNEIEFENSDFQTFSHPHRASLTAETGACLRYEKESPRTLVAHLHSVQDHAAFREFRLYETMVMALRPASPEVRAMCAAWWRMMSGGSRRDQLSLPLAVAETPDLRVGLIPGNIETTPYFAKIKH